jgi:hypothetical protein
VKICFREETIEELVFNELSLIKLTDEEHEYARQQIRKYRADWAKHHVELKQSLQLKLSQNKELLNRLIDAFLERLVEKEAFETKKADLLMQQKAIDDQLASTSSGEPNILDHLEKIFELSFDAYSLYKTGFQDEKRWLLETLTSNRQVIQKELVFTLAFPFREIAERSKSSCGAPQRATLRTMDHLVARLLAYLKENPAPRLERETDSEFSVAA